MKKIVMLILAIVILFLTGSVSSFAEEISMPNYQEVTGTYPDGTTGFVYSDDMLLGESSEMSGDLCKVAASLSAAAYDENSVTNMLHRIGYESYGFDYGDRDIYDYDRVAYVIAKKPVNDMLLYSIVIRGSSGYEWFGNFNMEDSDAHGGKHPGFSIAANKVIETLDSVFENDEANKENTILFFTGHSRGAAVANLLAAHYTKSQEFATADHIHAYTFACPAVTKHPVAYNNIFNFNITGDAIPAVPLAEWGYYRNGIDYPLGTQAEPAFSTRYLTTFGKNNASTPDTVAYEVLVKTLFPTEETVMTPKGHFFSMLLAWKMAKQPFSLGDFLVRYGYDVFSDNSLFQEVTSKTDLQSIYELLSEDYAKYTYDDCAVKDQEVFLKDAIKKTANYTEDEFGEWLHENTETLSKITNVTGKALEEYADLAAALNVVTTIINNAPVAWDAGTIIGCILDICGNSTNGVNAILDGHRTGTYILKINADYFGYQGWKAVQGFDRIALPDNIKTIGAECFYQSDVSTISGIEHIECIGNYAFHGSNLNNLNISNTIVEERAFSCCEKLQQVEIGDNVILRDGVFELCGSEDYPMTISIGNNVTLGDIVFYLDNIDSLSLPCNFAEGVSEESYPIKFSEIKTLIIRNVGNGRMLDNNEISSSEHRYAYYGLGAMVEEVIFEEGITHVASELFVVSDLSVPTLKKIMLPSTLKTIGDRAFDGQMGLSSIWFPKALNKIGLYAFSYTSMEDIFFEGNPEEWNKIDVDLSNYNDGLFSARYHFDLSTLIPDFVTPATLQTIDNEAFAGCAFQIVKLNDEITTIADFAFADCVSLKYIFIPESVNSIGDNAFNGRSFKFMIIAPKGSFAERYARDNHILFGVLEKKT